MAEITRLSGSSEWIDLDFVERKRTPERAMKLGIQMHVAGLSLSNTISVLDNLGVQHSRKAVHDWVQKAYLHPDRGENLNQVALDESVIRINDQQYWLYITVDPDTNKFLHIRLFTTYATALTEIFPGELREKHDVDDAVFLVDDADWLRTALQRHGLDFRYEKCGNRNSVKRVFQEVKRRTTSFSNCFSNAEAQTADDWLKSFSLHGIS